MYACYLLTGISFCLVGLTGIQGYWDFSVLGGNTPSVRTCFRYGVLAHRNFDHLFLCWNW